MRRTTRPPARISRAGKQEVRTRIIQDESGRGVPVFVLRPKLGEKLTITTTTTTTVEVEADKKPPKTIAAQRRQPTKRGSATRESRKKK